MFYKVEIEEVLSRVIEIDAESQQDAVKKLKDMYYGEDVVLDDDDFVDREFNVIDKSETIDWF